MASRPSHDWDRRVIGWSLVALVVLVVLVGDPRGDSGSGDPGGSDEPETAAATPAELCGSLDQMAVVRDAVVDGTNGATMTDLREAATYTEDVGSRTEGLDEQASAGLEFFVGLFLALPDDPTTQQLLSAGAPASVTDQAHSDALVSWLGDNCAAPPAAGR